MVDIQSVAAEIRRGKKKVRKIEDRKKLQGKNIMVPLLHRAAIKSVMAKAVSGHNAPKSGMAMAIPRASIPIYRWRN